jgi:N utilization substance protein B
VGENRRKIDELIMTYAQGWDMDRLPAVDRNILRIGIFEILWSTSVPTSVSIDEALNLAKELSSDDSSKYIHGVLARIASLKDSISI